MSKIPRFQLKLSLTQEEIDRFTELANMQRIPVSTWARLELDKLAFKVSTSGPQKSTPNHKQTAEDYYSSLPPSEPPPILQPKNTTPNPADVFVNPIAVDNPFVETKEQRIERRVDMCKKGDLSHGDLDSDELKRYGEKYVYT